MTRGQTTTRALVGGAYSLTSDTGLINETDDALCGSTVDGVLYSDGLHPTASGHAIVRD